MSGRKKVVSELTAKRLRELLHYDPDTGVWTRKYIRKGYLVGSIAGKISKSGYERIGVDMERYQAHRLAWLYMTGKWPIQQIDHINGIRNDNRWKNLRLATNSQNQINRLKQKPNKTGKNGVIKTNDHWRKKPFSSRICINGKHYYLGRFSTAEEAHAAYKAASIRLHGNFSRYK